MFVLLWHLLYLVAILADLFHALSFKLYNLKEKNSIMLFIVSFGSFVQMFSILFYLEQSYVNGPSI